MTELDQLKADLATIQKAAEIAKKQGWHERTGNYDQVELEIKGKIADLEAQADKWERARGYVDHALKHYMPSNGLEIAKYARHLEAKVAELDHELRCERIDGGKVRDDQKAINAEKNREKLAELTTILNAIPPACGLARELVEKRIEGIKKEIQGNG